MEITDNTKQYDIAYTDYAGDTWSLLIEADTEAEAVEIAEKINGGPVTITRIHAVYGWRGEWPANCV